MQRSRQETERNNMPPKNYRYEKFDYENSDSINEEIALMRECLADAKKEKNARLMMQLSNTIAKLIDARDRAAVRNSEWLPKSEADELAVIFGHAITKKI